MSSDPQNPPNPKEEQPPGASNNNNASFTLKKSAEKEAAKKQKLHSKAVASLSTSPDAPDPLATCYGDVLLEELQSKAVTGCKRTGVGSLTEELKGPDGARAGSGPNRPSRQQEDGVSQEKGFTV